MKKIIIDALINRVLRQERKIADLEEEMKHLCFFHKIIKTHKYRALEHKLYREIKEGLFSISLLEETLNETKA
jgi:hypothetical protein